MYSQYAAASSGVSSKRSTERRPQSGQHTAESKIICGVRSRLADTVICHPRRPVAAAAAAAAAASRSLDADGGGPAGDSSAHYWPISVAPRRICMSRARRPSPLNASQVAAEFASVRRAAGAVRPIFH